MRALPMRVVVLCALLAACGASARQKELRATYNAAVVAQDSWSSYDTIRQREIISQAKDEPSGKVALLSYQAGEQSKVVSLFEGLYHAISAASILNADPNLTGLAKAYADLVAELKLIGVMK
jgi:hypothetical protein